MARRRKEPEGDLPPERVPDPSAQSPPVPTELPTTPPSPAPPASLAASAPSPALESSAAPVPPRDAELELALEKALGFLNFSAGASDPQFLANLNRIYQRVLGTINPAQVATATAAEPPWRLVVAMLRLKLTELQAAGSTAFRDSEQATAVLRLLENDLIPAYWTFHRDLLFHQSPETVFNAFMLGRFCEVLLKQGAPWNETERLVNGSIKQLNDYIGHRPVPQLETRKIEAHPHEWLRPVPLYVRGAGVVEGPMKTVVETALRLLADTHPSILNEAQFDLARLDELAFDPRAYDFDHPANKRPNYHFGQWDPHQIDQHGFYRRFVIQQVTLDALMRRPLDTSHENRDELMLEAAAVLAGIILMSSGVSGHGPEAHDSSVTLSSLLPSIARFRDEFYEQLIRRITGNHAKRLREEAKERQQPFGGARQHLNAELARRRATQLEHVQLAKLFARMGFPEAALKQAAVVPTASARMLCRIDCWLTEGNRAATQGELTRARELLSAIVDQLHRGIQCGAIIDPWNILGFDAHYSLFPAIENSVHDERADAICLLVEQICELFSHTWSEAAVRDDQPLCRELSREFSKFSDWWFKFATHEVTSVESVNTLEAYRGAQHVVEAINLWHKGGAATGNIAFWSPYADMFSSPQAYALVVDILLKKQDFVAAMGLLIHWLNQAEPVGLVAGEISFHQLAIEWLSQLLFGTTRNAPLGTTSAAASGTGAASAAIPAPLLDANKRWQLARKFLDYLEANAGDQWRVPNFELRSEPGRKVVEEPAPDEPWTGQEQDELDEADDSERFDEAYRDMVYVDSTDDGVDAPIIEKGDTTHDELSREARRLSLRLEFLSCLAHLWKLIGIYTAQSARSQATVAAASDDCAVVLKRLADQASTNYDDLLNLLDQIRGYRIPPPGVDQDSMVEYDQRRYTKETLMEQLVDTAIETVDSRRLLLASACATCSLSDAQLNAPKPAESLNEAQQAVQSSLQSLEPDEQLATMVLAAVFIGNVRLVRQRWSALKLVLGRLPLLYVPLSRGGQPRSIVAARLRQRTLQDLLTCFPRLGLYLETTQLIDCARSMESRHTVMPGAVTEFDELFKVGFKSMVGCLVDTMLIWQDRPAVRGPAADTPAHALVECLEELTESMLLVWLSHSKTLRLSMLEKIHDRRSWKSCVEFIERYGSDLFVQHFLGIGNIRSILHHGVDNWLTNILEDESSRVSFRLLDDLQERRISLGDATEQLTLILEAIHENYAEYRDYNSTTTQSDRGEMLYTFMDFLRLRTKYDRIAWNLKPVVWVHDVLVRRRQEHAALVWRRALSDRIDEEAEQFMQSLAELQRRYAMRLPTIADRLSERFLRPLSIDRIRALVEPAMREGERGGPHPTFDELEKEADLLTLQPSGVGFDVPSWLVALGEEVDHVRYPLLTHDYRSALQAILPVRAISEAAVRRQLKNIGPKE